MSLGRWAAGQVVSAVVGAGAEQLLGITVPQTPPKPPPLNSPATGSAPAGDEDVQANLRSLPKCSCGAELFGGKVCKKCGSARRGKRGK